MIELVLVMNDEYEEDEEIDTDEPVVYLYVQRHTGWIYQCQIFDNFVLYRPATPGFEQAVNKVSTMQFLDKFEEFEGSYAAFYDYLRGDVPWREQLLFVDFR